jgi:hypothetical protein
LEGKISWGHGNTWDNGTGHTSYYKILVGLKCNHTINASTNGDLNKVSG